MPTKKLQTSKQVINFKRTLTNKTVNTWPRNEAASEELKQRSVFVVDGWIYLYDK